MKIYPYPSTEAEKRVDSVTQRGLSYKKKDLTYVGRILEEVKKEGDGALIRYARKFDSPALTRDSLKVQPHEFKIALKSIDRPFTRALNRAIANIETFHKLQIQKSWMHTDPSGTLTGQLVNPVDSAGVYVPGATGGMTPLVSSVLMGAIPAKIAGVKRVVMVTPPTADGTVNPYILAAAKKVGIKEVYKIGSAWAVAALAYGSDTIAPVDVIVGPGNIYVTLAKKLVAGTVGIDMIAGPSEILVVADQNANPEYIAADLLSQAEHDTLASAILVTNSRDIATAVSQAVSRRLKQLHRRKIAEASIAAFGAIFTVKDIPAALDLANRIAPEHLEIQVKNPHIYLGRIRNAGAVFLGDYTPEPVGDYIAGPNHVLPTAGTARFSSALSVDHFIKKTSLIHYSEAAFHKEAADILRLAEIEGLEAHAESVRVRLTSKKRSRRN